ERPSERPGGGDGAPLALRASPPSGGERPSERPGGGDGAPLALRASPPSGGERPSERPDGGDGAPLALRASPPSGGERPSERPGGRSFGEDQLAQRRAAQAVHRAFVPDEHLAGTGKQILARDGALAAGRQRDARRGEGRHQG